MNPATTTTIKMQATLGHLSRLVSRSFVTGVVNKQEQTHHVTNSKKVEEDSSSDNSSSEDTKLVTAVSGFPKAKSGKFNIDAMLKGQIGDDAWFVARHVDDWSTNTNGGQQLSNEAILSPDVPKQTSPVVSASSTTTNRRNNSADVIGVADGVGGWRQYGVDPGQFSSALMKNCERLVKAGYFTSNAPARLIAQGYREMQECKKQIIGSSTACVMVLSHADSKLYTANIGDSGFLVVRDGRVVHRSSEQQHFFNTPFQLSLPPSEMRREVLMDDPETADRYEFKVEDGDVIMLATDGIFDNVPDSILVDEISSRIVFSSSNSESSTSDDERRRSSKKADKGYSDSGYSSDSELSSSSTSSSTSADAAVLSSRLSSTSLDEAVLSRATTSKSSASSSTSDEASAIVDDSDLSWRLQQCANSIALMARKLSQDPDFLSPFAQNARANGFNMSGGKEDDITVLLAAVRLGNNATKHQ